jgi:hypothetical protein
MSETNNNTNEAGVTTEHITHLQELEELIKCDSGHVFVAKNCKLIPFVTTDRLDDVVYIDQNYEIKQGSTENEKKKMGFLVACPVCGLVHLSMFSRPNLGQESVIHAGQDNTIPDRILTID